MKNYTSYPFRLFLFLVLIGAVHYDFAFAGNSTQSEYLFSERPRTQTLFSSDVRHGGFGSLIYGATGINGEVALLRGTRGAWILNLSPQHAIHLGLAGYRTQPEITAASWPHSDVERPDIRTSYGGFEFEYVNQSFRLVHLGTQLLIGSGTVRYENRNIDLEKTRDDYFVVQPGVNLFLNVTRWFRISGGAYYRYAANVDLDGTSSTDLSGLTGIIGLRFGRF